MRRTCKGTSPVKEFDFRLNRFFSSGMAYTGRVSGQGQLLRNAAYLACVATEVLTTNRSNTPKVW